MTDWPRPVRTALRLCLASFCWLTAAYAFVVSSAFAYLQFVRPRVFPWIGQFSDWHSVLCLVWMLLAVVAVWPDIRRRSPAGPLAIAFVVASGAATLWNYARPVLPGLTDGDRSIIVGVAALVPLVWLAAIDYLNARSYLSGQRAPQNEIESAEFEGRLFIVSVGSAVFVTILYAMLASIPLAGAFEPDLRLAGIADSIFKSLVGHLIVFAAAFLLFAVLVRVARGRFVLQLAATILVLLTASSLAFATLVGDALSMHGAAGAVAAIATASSIVGVWIGLRLRTLQLENARVASALDVLWGSKTNSRASTILRVVAVAVLAYGLMLLSALADWDFVLLEAGVLVVWCCSFGVVYRATSWQRAVSHAVVAATCLSPLAVGFVIRQAPPPAAVGPAPVDRTARYAIYNPSFRVVSQLLRDSRTTIPSFDRYLVANTGLTALHVDPIDIDFVPKLEPTARPKPHIFLFVIDSLRPDYLSPYNPQIRFTPRIAEFAAESIVFANAFTRFGGTGLSVPAMWAGSSIVHKQYVQPFHPMNALEKLLDANGYRKILGLDSIMSQLLIRSNAIEELDRGRTNMDFEICRTLDELDSKLQGIGSTPVFAYSLPQDIHMSRLPRTVEHGEEYRSFYAPYATKVHAFDACFGRFIDGLKRRGQFDRSLVVVTADHGEMLGEDGRFGHSYHLFPQVVQVPLIIHFPASIADAVDADAVSLTTDITPTIYAALGYEPVQANDLMGRPLIGADDRVSTARRRDTYVIAASYGAVYAVLRHNGRRLYIADAIKGGDQAYERDNTGRWHDVGITEGLRVVNQFAIRQYVDRIARIYGIGAR